MHNWQQAYSPASRDRAQGQHSNPGQSSAQHRQHFHHSQPRHRPQQRQRPPPPPTRNTPPKPAPWHDELEDLSEKLATRSANFLSLQMAPYDHNPKEILEIGWSYLDPTRKHAPFEEAMITMHFISSAGTRFHNGSESKNNRHYFKFGHHSLEHDTISETGTADTPNWDSNKSFKMPLDEITDRLRQTIERLVKDKRPLYIILHGNKRGLDAIYDAGVDTSQWGQTAFGTVEENDYIATDMGGMDLSDLNALQQAARMARDAKYAEEESRKYHDQLHRLRYPGDHEDPDDSGPQVPLLNSRFGSGSGSGNRYTTATSGNDTDTSYRTAAYSFDRGKTGNNSTFASRFQQQGGPQLQQQQKQQNPQNLSKREQKRQERDRFGDGYDAWGQPLDDSDLDDDEDDLDGWKPSFAPSIKLTDPDVKIIDTVTLMKALEYRWTEPNINPTAKEPPNPNVEEMVRSIDLRRSNFGRDIKLWMFDNAGNDAHYTLLSFAEMCRRHSQQMGNPWWQIQAPTTHASAAASASAPRPSASADTEPTNVKLDPEGPPPPTAVPPRAKPSASADSFTPPRGVKREPDDGRNEAGPSQRPPEPAAKKKKKAFNTANTPLDILDEEYECLRQIWAGDVAPSSSVKTEEPSPSTKKPCNVFVAIDIETWEHNHAYTLEVGWAIHYPDIFEFDKTGSKQDIITSHFIVKENKELRNSDFVRGQRDHFLHGSAASEKVERPKKGGTGGECEVLSNKSCVASEDDIWKRLSNKLKNLQKHVDAVYLVFHDAGGDMDVLDTWDVFKGRLVLPFFDINTRRHSVPPPIQSATGSSAKNAHEKPFWVIDTQRLMRAYQHSAQVTSVHKMTDELVLDPAISNKRLHNAGNDAFYTLFGMKVMAAGPELAKFRQEKQEERKRIPRATVRTAPLLSWDQDFPEEEEEVAGAKVEQETTLDALGAEQPTIPGSQERMKPVFELMEAWHGQKCAFMAIRAVMIDNQVVELAWSIIDRRSISRQLEQQKQERGADSSFLLPQPQRTYHTIDMENIHLLKTSGQRFYADFRKHEINEEKSHVSKGATVLVNGTIASSQRKMGQQMRKVIAGLRKGGGTVYLVFHGPPDEHPFPKIGIPNESLPPELQDIGAKSRSDQEILEDEKLASISLLDSALLFERFKEKADTLRDADFALLDNTNPTLTAVCEELRLLRGLDGLELENAGNNVHLILRAIAYMATTRPDIHIQLQSEIAAAAANGSGSGDTPENAISGSPTAPMSAEDKMARLRALSAAFPR